MVISPRKYKITAKDASGNIRHCVRKRRLADAISAARNYEANGYIVSREGFSKDSIGYSTRRQEISERNINFLFGGLVVSFLLTSIVTSIVRLDVVYFAAAAVLNVVFWSAQTILYFYEKYKMKNSSKTGSVVDDEI